MAYQKILCLMFLSMFLPISFSFGPLLDSPPPPQPINSIFQFGDSLSDTGNLKRMGYFGAFLCGRLPYGKTLGVATGRCSDGLLMIDYIAAHFGLPALNPYLDRLANFSHGVNFAVAGSTALDTFALNRMGLFVPGINNPLSVQLRWFRSHLKTLCSSTADCKKFLNNSLILMGEIGGNDYNYALMEGRTTTDLKHLVLKVVRVIKAAVEEVINLGATKILVPGNLPIGCTPIFLTTFQSKDQNKYDELNCLKDLNGFARIHNYVLQRAIKALQQEHPNVTIVYGDYYNGMRYILQNAASLGFNVNETQMACCGSDVNIKYNFDFGLMCPFGAPVCKNPHGRLSWDGIHLTQHAYKQLAEYLLSKTNVVQSLFYN